MSNPCSNWNSKLALKHNPCFCQHKFPISVTANYYECFHRADQLCRASEAPYNALRHILYHCAKIFWAKFYSVLCLLRTLGGRKAPESKSQSMWQVQKDVWRFCFVLFCSLIKDLELPFECERERQLETKLWTKLTIKLASSFVCPIFGFETQSERM